MNSAKFIGNCSKVINWDEVIAILLSQTASTIAPMFGIGYNDDCLPDEIARSDDFQENLKLWKNAGYKSVNEGGSAEWHMFYPGVNFDESIVNKFVNFFKIPIVNRCWISMILPGKCAPWHVDQHILPKNSPRYHCHIGNHDIGHVLMIDNDYFIKTNQGDTYLWNDVYAWHSGFNAGRTPKFLFNLC
jgi:hypothetical protein